MIRDILMLPFRPARQPSWYGPAGYLAALLAVALATGVLWIAKPVITLGSIYLVYLVVVVAIAVGWGLKQGVEASLLSFLAANFFFIQPVFTFTIANAQDVLALMVFLGLATLTSQLVARLRQEAQDAGRSQHITATLYSLSQTINRQHNLQPLLEEACAQLCAALDLDACTISLRSATSPRMLTVHRGVPLTVEDDSAAVTTVRTPLYSSDKSAGNGYSKRDGDSAGEDDNVIGMLVAQVPAKHHLTTEERQLIDAFAGQLQVAAERARLQQVEIQTEVLRRTDELRAALLSAVAHDLRGPLGSIKTAATSLRSPRLKLSADDQREFLNTIVGEADHISRLVSNLLDMSRIEAGKLRPQKEPHRIEEVIAGVLERLQPRLDRHPVRVDIAENLPVVPFDKVEIDEVITNLLENSVKYTPAGTLIGVRAGCSDGDTVEVEIWDEGPGVPPEHMANLFDRFYRVKADGPGAPTSIPGMGLGLSIARGIITAHKGQIKAANRPGGGMSVTFTLPVRPPEAADKVE